MLALNSAREQNRIYSSTSLVPHLGQRNTSCSTGTAFGRSNTVSQYEQQNLPGFPVRLAWLAWRHIRERVTSSSVSPFLPDMFLIKRICRVSSRTTARRIAHITSATIGFSPDVSTKIIRKPGDSSSSTIRTAANVLVWDPVSALVSMSLLSIPLISRASCFCCLKISSEQAVLIALIVVSVMLTQKKKRIRAPQARILEPDVCEVTPAW